MIINVIRHQITHMRIFFKITFLLLFVGTLVAIIGYARGYRLDTASKSLTSTGIIATSSSPRASKVYVNGELKGVTDLNLTLPPNKYFIEVKKEGFSTWSKQITLKGELVMVVDPVLFPLNPSLTPLTNLGITKTIPLPGSERVILVSETGDALKDGIYLFETARRPIPFFPPLKTIILKSDMPIAPEIKLSEAEFAFSPDYKQFMIEITDPLTPAAYLFKTDAENQEAFDTTQSKDSVLAVWNEEKDEQNIKLLQTFPRKFVDLVDGAIKIVAFSPDDNKLVYMVTQPVVVPLILQPPLIAANQTTEERALQPGKLYVYDKKEDKNFPISFAGNFVDETNVIPSVTPFTEILSPTPQPLDVEFFTGQSLPITWYPDSKHLVYNEGNKLTVSDYDGHNKHTVYSGPFTKSFFSVTSDGKLVVLLNLNPESNPYPDLYLVGIR